MTALYNEIDRSAAQWMRNLIAAGHIANGVVDERSIAGLRADDVSGHGQRHFFAGIGGWAYALRLAGVSDDADVWTGSCPCQPFSSAGRGAGTADARHLWPEWFRLIAECRPPVIFGEQVFSAAIVGRHPANKDLQGLRDREAVLGVLRELQGQSPEDLYRLREVELAEEQARERGEDEGITEELEGQQEGVCPSERGQASGANSRDALRPGCPGDPNQDRRGRVRAVRDRVRSDGAARVERAITGSDRLEHGLHDEQHPDRALRGKRDGQRMGRGEDPRGRRGDQGSGAFSFGGLIDEAGRAAEEESRGAWIDAVRADLESVGYAVGFSVLPAAGVGAPHIRQRLYFVAYADGESGRLLAQKWQSRRADAKAERRGEAGGVADGHDIGRRSRRSGEANRNWTKQPAGLRAAGAVVDATRGGWIESVGRVRSRKSDADRASKTGALADRSGSRLEVVREQSARGELEAAERGGAVDWSSAHWIPCSDGKARPVEPGTHPLAHGVPGRVGLLRGYGNAIVPAQAAAFVVAALESIR